MENIVVALPFYGIGVVLIIGGIRNLMNKSEKDISTKLFILSVAVISIFTVSSRGVRLLYC